MFGVTRGTTGSSLVKALEKWVSLPQTGQITPTLIKSMQIKMKTYVDGKVSNPSSLVKAMRKAIAEGTMPS